MSKKITVKMTAIILAGIIIASGFPGLAGNTNVSASEMQSEEETIDSPEEGMMDSPEEEVMDSPEEEIIDSSEQEMIDSSEEVVFDADSGSANSAEIMESGISTLSTGSVVYDPSDFIGIWESMMAVMAVLTVMSWYPVILLSQYIVA